MWTMLCLQGSRADHGEAADSQVGLIVPFALFNLFLDFLLNGTSVIFPRVLVVS